MQPLLEVKKVAKKYRSFEALKCVSLDLFRGELVSLLGVNGAGKTTLSSIIATLKPPTSGDILFQGRSIFSDIAFYRRHVGYCAQKSNLNGLLTIRDNLIFAGYYYGMSKAQINARLDELDAHLGIGKFIDHYPKQLSGGWRQRYMIARTLMHSPLLIILDEPTAALDPDIRQQLWIFIQEVRNSGVCILMTTHYMEEAEQLSNRICVLHHGEIKLFDTTANLLKQYGKNRLEEVFLQFTLEQQRLGNE